MRKLLVIICLLIFYTGFGQGQNKYTSFLTSTFFNKNVYKTRTNLMVKKAYKNNPATDLQPYIIAPSGQSALITQTKVTVTTTQDIPAVGAAAATPSTTSTTTEITTLPPTVTKTTVLKIPAAAASHNETTLVTTTIEVPAELNTSDYIRYKIVYEDGDSKFIRILPGCKFTTTGGNKIIQKKVKADVSDSDKPEDYIFEVTNKDLVPNTHYLASTALIGKVITIPLKVRNQYWDKHNKVLEGSLSLGYGFGWKFKFGNNPYRTHYLSIVPYAAGISQQKYFSLAGKYAATNLDSLSASTDQIAVTYFSCGIAYEYDKFNIGIFAGRDKMFGELKNWLTRVDGGGELVLAMSYLNKVMS